MKSVEQSAKLPYQVSSYVKDDQDTTMPAVYITLALLQRAAAKKSVDLEAMKELSLRGHDLPRGRIKVWPSILKQ